jgi:transposase
LSMMVRGSGEDMYSGHLYVFVSRRRDQVRVLTWQRGGFVLLW